MVSGDGEAECSYSYSAGQSWHQLTGASLDQRVIRSVCMGVVVVSWSRVGGRSGCLMV